MKRASLSNMALIAALMSMAGPMGSPPPREMGERPPKQPPEIKAAKLSKAEKKRAKRAERNLRLAEKQVTQ